MRKLSEAMGEDIKTNERASERQVEDVSRNASTKAVTREKDENHILKQGYIRFGK